MSAPELLGVGTLGGIGAIARFGLDGTVSERVRSTFPYGTFVVNLVGSFLLGILVGVTLDSAANALMGTGFIGAFTTFSTWLFETHRLGEDRRLAVGLVNIAVSLVLGVAAAWAGEHVGAAL
ncbi:MAG TPA: fluoride efflux transporter CrcB [Solirubrobacteraceae bacterium]|nr:fluoride efflux transporter CrcB [Solirubrobacteraceae bacterium]